MPSPLVIAGIAKGVFAGAKFLFGRTPKFQDTERGKRLSNIAEHGVIDATAKSSILGNLGAVTGNIAQGEKSEIRGSLVKDRMLKSISAKRLLSAPAS